MDNSEDLSTYIIVYPRGDRSRLAVVEIVPALDYEKGDYAIASRKEFFGDNEGACKYARELARENGLSYEGSNRDDHDFLD
jgi:hypothetical protein